MTDEIILQLLRLWLNPDYQSNVSLFLKVVSEKSVRDFWNGVIERSISYGIGAIAFDNVESLPVDLRPDMDNLMDWLGQTSYQESLYMQSWRVSKQLGEIWGDTGISATVLKGRSIAQYYPKP